MYGHTHIHTQTYARTYMHTCACAGYTYICYRDNKILRYLSSEVMLDWGVEGALLATLLVFNDDWVLGALLVNMSNTFFIFSVNSDWLTWPDAAICLRASLREHHDVQLLQYNIQHNISSCNYSSYKISQNLVSLTIVILTSSLYTLCRWTRNDQMTWPFSQVA